MRFIVWCFAVTIILLGCGQNNVLMSPGLRASEVNDQSSHYIFAMADIRIDSTNLSVEILPVRDMQTHMNVLQYLEKGPCFNCLKIASVVPSGNGTLLVGINITNPYKSLNLTIFDVRGIAMFNGTRVYPSADVVASDKSAGEDELVNADGFTTLYNVSTEGSGAGGIQGYQQGRLASKTKPTATLNGFKRFVSANPSNTRNAFLPNDSITCTYEIKTGPSPLIFGYAVDANWVRPTKDPVVDPMSDFPLSANCFEPWKLDITEHPVSDGLTDLGGQTTLSISVYSWEPGHFTVYAETPELFDSAVSTEAVTGSGSGYKNYELTIDNLKLALEGDYKCLVWARNKSNPIVPPYIDLTAYQTINLHVNHAVIQTLPPIALAEAAPNPTDPGMHIHFQDNGSYDPDGGSIVNFEWDWNNDGVFDESGADLYHVWDNPGIYYVQFRVTDDEAQTGVLTEPIVITINGSTAYTWDNTIADILKKSCGHCHVYNNEGGILLDTYDDMIASNVMVKYDPMSSTLYTAIYQGTHYATLTDNELNELYEWILNGAPEN